MKLKVFNLINVLGYLTLSGVGMIYAGYEAIYDHIAAEFGKSSNSYGAFIYAFYIGNFLAMLISGELTDRISKRLTLLAGLIMITASGLIIMLSEAVWILFFGIGLFGGGFGIVESIMTSILIGENQGSETAICNLTQTFFSLGAIISPIISIWYISQGGSYRMIFMISAIWFFLLFIPFRILPLSPGACQSTQKEKFLIFKVLSNPRFRITALIMLTYLGIEAGFGFYIKSFFAEIFGQEQSGVLALSAFWMAMVGSRLLTSFVQIDDFTVLKWTSSGMFLSLMIFLIIPDALARIILTAVFGFACGPVWPTLFATAASSETKYTGTASSLIVLSGTIGGMLIPPVIGAVGNMRIIFILLTIISVVMCIEVLFFIKIRVKHIC